MTGTTTMPPRGARLARAFNPLMRALMRAGMPAGPNVLLTVAGRRTGVPHTFPVALMQVGARRFVQSPYGEVDWVRNLRVAGRGTLVQQGRSSEVDAIELT